MSVRFLPKLSDWISCKLCDGLFKARLVKGEPKTKGYCSRGCVDDAKRIGLIYPTRRGNSMEKGSSRVDGYGTGYLDSSERNRAFNRFRSSYEEYLDTELLIERFGEWYYEWEPQMSDESRAKRKKMKKDMCPKDTGKCPELPMMGLRLRIVNEA